MYMVPLPIAPLLVRRYGVMNNGMDAMLCQMGFQAISVGTAQGVDMPHVVASRIGGLDHICMMNMLLIILGYVTA